MEQYFKMVSEGPVTLENPGRYFEGKGLLYRESLINQEGRGEPS